MTTRDHLYQLVIVWLLAMGGDRARLEPVFVSKPLPLAWCETLQVKVRTRPSKYIMAYCI